MTRHPRTEPAIPRCVICLRCSADKQAEKDLSIPAQRDACRAAARQRGWEVVAEYVDEAESARSDDRPEFRKMLAAARSKPLPFDYILVWKFSRFSRNREHSVLYKRQLERHGVRVVSLNEPVDDSPAGRMLEGILEVIDEFYSANLAQDIERGMRKNATMGFRNGGPPPVGYVRVRSGSETCPRIKLEPDPTWAPVVKRMFSLALAGEGVTRIAETLSDDELTTPRGKPWTKTRVHDILTNEVYTGVNIWGVTRSEGQAHRPVEPVRVDDTHEPLISREDFDRVQAMMRTRSPKRVSPNILRGNYLLSGLLFCGTCGAPLIGHAAKGGRNHYYGCQTKLKQGAQACAAKLLPQAPAEQAVIATLRTILTPEYLRDLVDRVNADLAEGADASRAEVAALEAQHADAQRKLDRLYEALESGALDLDILAPRMREAKARTDTLAVQVQAAREALGGQVVHLVDDGTVQRYLDRLHDLLDTGSVDARRAVLRSFVRRIVADGMKLTLHYELPPLPGSDGSSSGGDDSTGVLPRGRSGDPNGIFGELKLRLPFEFTA